MGVPATTKRLLKRDLAAAATVYTLCRLLKPNKAFADALA